MFRLNNTPFSKMGQLLANLQIIIHAPAEIQAVTPDQLYYHYQAS